MVEQLVTYLDQIVPLEEREKAFVRTEIPIVTFSKKEFLLKEQQVSDRFYFNISGMIRMFYTKDPDEVTTYFYQENEFISAYESFVRQTPSRLNLQAMEDTTVAEISLETSKAMLEFSGKFEVIARIAMEEENIISQQIIASLLTMTPEERYDQLIEQNPTVLQRIPQHYIASFIGVRPESLSRIKKRVAQRLT